jgi:hypothetical protein
MPQRLRIFISSPSDVPDERLRAALVVDKLAQDYRRFFALEVYRWEHEPMLASGHFQDAIEPPSKCDIVILVLWSRLGTPLPEKTDVREYRGIDGRAPVTGTEWEYEDALAAAREHGAPDILAFRNTSDVPVNSRDTDAQTRSLAQLSALDAFWRRHFADRGVFLAAYDEYRTLDQFAHRLEEVLRKLIDRRIQALGPGSSDEVIWHGDPFRGLEPYEFEHAAIFFGRDSLVAKATEQLATRARSGCAFLLVSGPSGSGKSSLVKAALVPRLMKPQRIEGLAFVRRAVFRPSDGGNDIILGLVESLTRPGESETVGLPELLTSPQNPRALANYLRSAPESPEYAFGSALSRITQAGRKAGKLLAFEDAKLILVVDQLEELFTRENIPNEDRTLFIRLLGGLAKCGAVWVVATLRADFWHRAATVPELIALCEGPGRLDVPPPSAAELTDIIRKPAQAAGLSFEVHRESGLSLDAVIAEHAAAEPGVLPLLSFTLDALFSRDVTQHGSGVLTFASYEALGGLEGAIATRAEEVVARLPPGPQAALPKVLRSLATISSGAEHTPVARAAPLTAFREGSPARALVDALTESRLLVAANEGDVATVRLAHEALINHWTRARDQLVTDWRDLETRSLVERQQARWDQATGRARDQLLLRDPDLANALDLRRRWGDELAERTQAFIAASHRRARRRQQLSAAAAVVFALVAVAALFAMGIATTERQRAEQQSARAAQAATEAEQQRQSAEISKANAIKVLATSDFQRGSVLLLNEDTVSEGIASLARAVRQGRDSRALTRLWTLLQQRSFWLPTAPVELPKPSASTAAAPEIPAALKAKFAKVTVKGAPQETKALSVSGDGKTVFTAIGDIVDAVDVQYRLWRSDGTPITGWLTPEYKGLHYVHALRGYLSFDGRYLALEVQGWRETSYLQIFDLRTKKQIGENFTASGHSPLDQFVAFSDVRFINLPQSNQNPAEILLLAASAKGDAIAMKVTTDLEPLATNSHSGPVAFAGLDEKNEWLMSSGEDGTVVVSSLARTARLGNVLHLERPAVSIARIENDGLVVSFSTGERRYFSLQPPAKVALPADLKIDDRQPRCRKWGGEASPFQEALQANPLLLPNGEVTRPDPRRVAVTDHGVQRSISPSFAADVVLTCLGPAGDRLAITTTNFVTEIWATDFSRKFGLPINERPLFGSGNTPTEPQIAVIAPDGKGVMTESFLWVAPNLANYWLTLWDLDIGAPLTDRVHFGEDFAGDEKAVQSARFDATGRYLLFVYEEDKSKPVPVAWVQLQPPAAVADWIADFAEAVGGVALDAEGVPGPTPDRLARIKFGLEQLARVTRP